MRAVGVLAIVGVGVVVGGVAAMAYAKKEDDGSDILDLPSPTPDSCTTADRVWTSTQDVLANSEYSGDDLRKAADVLDTWGEFCDDDARVMAKSCSALLRARAEVLDNTPPGQTPNQSTSGVNLPPSPIELPGGHYYKGYGWCLPGAVLDMSTGLCTVSMPDVIKTSGACCRACAMGHECEGCS